jgi:hypothetical protein
MGYGHEWDLAQSREAVGPALKLLKGHEGLSMAYDFESEVIDLIRLRAPLLLRAFAGRQSGG